nr:MAG TPA: hypothetical protein [Bacteriophage sp.]
MFLKSLYLQDLLLVFQINQPRKYFHLYTYILYYRLQNILDYIIQVLNLLVYLILFQTIP